MGYSYEYPARREDVFTKQKKAIRILSVMIDQREYIVGTCLGSQE